MDAGHRWASEHAVLGDLHVKARPVCASAFDQGDDRQPAAVEVERPDPRCGNVAVREATADDPRELADDVHADAHSRRSRSVHGVPAVSRTNARIAAVRGLTPRRREPMDIDPRDRLARARDGRERRRDHCWRVVQYDRHDGRRRKLWAPTPKRSGLLLSCDKHHLARPSRERSVGERVPRLLDHKPGVEHQFGQP